MPVLEIVLFRSRDGVANEDLREAARQAQPEIATLPGFLGRELGQAANGTWLDQVRWSSMEAAQAAAQSVMTHPACAAYFRLIDEGSIVMHHYELGSVDIGFPVAPD